MHTSSVRDSGSYLLRIPHRSSSSKIDDPALAASISTAIAQWTHGQPLLTKVIRKYVDQYSTQIIRQEGAGIVDEIVRQKIVKDWSNNEAADYLNPIYKALLASDSKDRVLITYMQILSRGKLPYQKDMHTRAEQASLLRAGLVRLQGKQLVVSNRVCANVFDMAWIEQQTPGLTRGVSVIKPPETGYTDKKITKTRAKTRAKTSQRAKACSQVAVIGCSVVLLSALLSQYTQENSVNRVAASTVSVAQPVEATSRQSSQSSSVASSVLAADRQRFDQGIEHAANGRWDAMLQQFCYLPTSSVYFASATKQLESWLTLYPKEIGLAKEQLPNNVSSQCSILQGVQSKNK